MELKQNPEMLLVTRDGQLDDDYYQAVWEAKRRQALHVAGREALQLVLTAPLVVGKGIVHLFTHELSDSLQVK